jgi:SAM-dependent methyltransferase
MTTAVVPAMHLRDLQTESVPCNLCGATTTSPVLVNCGLTIVRCRSCNLVYVNPRPTEDALRAYYALPDLLDHKSWSSYRRHTARQLGALWGERFRDVQRWRSGAGTRLFDLGAGYGDFLHVAARAGWVTTGLEFSPAVARVAQEQYGIALHVGALETVDLAPDSLDVVSLWHVLEHMPDPRATLARLRQLLQPEGILVIEVPNIAFAVRRSYEYPLSATLHLYHFSNTTLSRTVHGAGFTVLECDNGNTGQLCTSWLKRLAKRTVHGGARLAVTFTGQNVSDSIRLYARRRD